MPEQHFTEPPPRYSEASLVKKLEELGIGRPSTYASIIQVLQDRDYVKHRPASDSFPKTAAASSPRSCRPTSRATSSTTSPPISRNSSTTSRAARPSGTRCCAISGRISPPPSSETKELRFREVSTRSTRSWAPHFFPPRRQTARPADLPILRRRPAGLKLGKFGAFIGCSNYPTCKFTRKLGIVDPEKDALSGANLGEPKVMGVDPATGKRSHAAQRAAMACTSSSACRGQGEAQARLAAEGHDAGRAHLRAGAGAPVAAARTRSPSGGQGNGAGGHRPLRALSQHGSKYKSIPADESVLEIGINRAVACWRKPRQRPRPRRGEAAACRGQSPCRQRSRSNSITAATACM